MFNTQSSAIANKLSQDQLLLRINGILPDIATLGSIEKSERAAEVKRLGTSQKYFLFFICHGKGN